MTGEWTTQIGKNQRDLLKHVGRFPGEASSFHTKAGFRQSVIASLRDRGFIEDQGSEDRRAWVLTEKGFNSISSSRL